MTCRSCGERGLDPDEYVLENGRPICLSCSEESSIQKKWRVDTKNSEGDWSEYDTWKEEHLAFRRYHKMTREARLVEITEETIQSK